jgi:hypothetical protein
MTSEDLTVARVRRSFSLFLDPAVQQALVDPTMVLESEAE